MWIHSKWRRSWLPLVLCAITIVLGYLSVDRTLFPHRSKYQQSVGLTTQQVLERLGSPDRRMALEQFACVEKFLCHPAHVQGDVLFYREGYAGYYVYLNRSGVVAQVDAILRD